ASAIEQPDCGWLRLRKAKLLQRAAHDHLLFRRRVDEHQILLSVIVKPKVVLWPKAWLQAGNCGAQAVRRGPALLGYKPVNAVDGLDRDPPALLQPANQLAIVDSLATEGCLRDIKAAACL